MSHHRTTRINCLIYWNRPPLAINTNHLARTSCRRHLFLCKNPKMWMQISVPLHISCFLLRRDLPSQHWLLIIILDIVCTEQWRSAAGTAALCSYILHVSAALLLCFWGQTSPFQLVSLCLLASQ